MMERSTSTKKSSSRETAEQRERRIRYEMAVIAQGHADIDAGLGIEIEDLHAWLDLLDTEPDAPLPTPKPKATGT
jgi:predicted transcriptional regulator